MTVSKARSVTITHLKDTDGTNIVTVSLLNKPELQVTLNEDDFILLDNLGVRPQWVLTTGIVLTSAKVAIPRLILDAKAGEKARYLDRNCLNLRRRNLVLVRGAAKFDARAMLLTGPIPLPLPITIEHIAQRPSWELADQLNPIYTQPIRIKHAS